MTKEEAIAELNSLAASDDPEADHIKADVVLCDFLISLGHEDVVKAWNAVEKWYA